MTTVFNARAVTWALTAMAAFAFFPAHGEDRLYVFVDEWGVAHFSNVPGDPRYRPVRWARTPAAPQPGPVSLSCSALCPGGGSSKPWSPGVPVPVAAKEFYRTGYSGSCARGRYYPRHAYGLETLTSDNALESSRQRRRNPGTLSRTARGLGSYSPSPVLRIRDRAPRCLV